MAVAVLPQLGTRQLMATPGWQQWVNSWSEAVELVLVCGSAVAWEWAGLYYWGMSSCRYYRV